MADTRPYKKHLPRIDEESRGNWEALARHELYFQRCRDCGTLRKRLWRRRYNYSLDTCDLRGNNIHHH